MWPVARGLYVGNKMAYKKLLEAATETGSCSALACFLTTIVFTKNSLQTSCPQSSHTYSIKS